jgi:hypothetical protein
MRKSCKLKSEFALLITLLHNLNVNQRKSVVATKAKPRKASAKPAARASRSEAKNNVATTQSEAQRLSAIEARLAALESQGTKTSATANAINDAAKLTAADDRFWALNELNRQHLSKPEDRGAVLYTGTVALPSGAQYVWQRQASTRELLEGDWRDLSETIAALAHPMRLEILKHALGQDRSTQDFMALPDMGTTGQLFHHVKALQDAGWLRSLQRGLYGVPGERVVPLLAMLTAARG